MKKIKCRNCEKTIIKAGQPDMIYWYHARSHTVWCRGNYIPDGPSRRDRLERAEPM